MSNSERVNYRTKTRAPKRIPKGDDTMVVPKRKSVRFMGIDQSLSCTGYVFTDYNCNVLHEGVLPTNKRSFNEARMDWIGTCIAGLLHQHGSDLLFVAMENLAFGGSGKMDLLAGVYWEIRRRVWCYHDNLEIYSVPIGTWKKFITGNGRAKKPLIREKINRKYNVYFDNENKYDAYGLLRYQIAMWRKKHGST